MSVNMTYISSISIQKGDRDGRTEENGESEKDYDLPGRVDAPGGQVSGSGCGNVDGGPYPADTSRASPESAGTAEVTSEKGGAAMRVEAGIYWRGNSLWIHYSFRGQTFRE